MRQSFATLATLIAGPALAALAGGCLDGELPPHELDSHGDLGSLERPIIAGTSVGSGGYPNVVLLDLGGGLCTGTVIEPNVVLTAAHCVEGVGSITAYFGTSFSQYGHDHQAIEDSENPPNDLVIDADDWVQSRFYSPTDIRAADVALVRLTRDVPADIPLATVNLDPLGQDLVGQFATTVGFGNNVAPDPPNDPSTGSGSGRMREVEYEIDSVTIEHVVVGQDSDRNACQGDSGGPTFAMVGGEQRIIGISSFVRGGCTDGGFMTRPDTYSNFVQTVVASWSGPCAADGMCDEARDCPYVDPDCDVCGFDGICGEMCENVDIDCPLAGLTGDLCDTKFDCESRLCIPWDEDDSVSYCSQSCDQAFAASIQCDLPLTACETGPDGADVCKYSGPPPGAQGSDCTSNGDCIEACDLSNNICVSSCTSQDDCVDGLVCRELGGAQVCTLPDEGGCCSVSGGDPKNLLLVVLVAGLLLLRRRRDRLSC